MSRSSESAVQIQALNNALVSEGFLPMEAVVEGGRASPLSENENDAISQLAAEGVELESVTTKSTDFALAQMDALKDRRMGMTLDESALAKARSTVEAKLVKQQAEAIALKDELERLEQLQAFALQKGELERENQALSDDKQALTEELDESKKQTELLQGNLNEKSIALNKLAEDYASIKTSLEAKDEELVGIKNDYEALNAEIEPLRASAARAEELAKKTDAVYKLTVEKLRSESKNVRKLNSEVKQKDSLIAELKTAGRRTFEIATEANNKVQAYTEILNKPEFEQLRKEFEAKLIEIQKQVETDATNTTSNNDFNG